jgi:hypothetical protein
MTGIRLLRNIGILTVVGALLGYVTAELFGGLLLYSESGRDPEAWAKDVTLTLRQRLPWGFAFWGGVAGLLLYLPRYIWPRTPPSD